MKTHCALPRRGLAAEHYFSAKSLAEHFKIDRHKFLRLFRKHADSSPEIMLADERDRQAVELLRAGKLSLKEISEALHYSQPSAFARAFKHRHGISPRAFRARHFEAPRFDSRAKCTAARIAPAARAVEKFHLFARPSRLIGGKTDSPARLVLRAQA